MAIATRFEAGPWRTNCWIVADGPGQECLIIDPGMDSAGRINEIVTSNRLKPIAVLLTHGHIDHMFSVFPVASGYGIPAYVHPEDRDRIGDPFATLERQTAAMIRQLGVEFAEPDELLDLTDGVSMQLAGLDLTVRHAPGHTDGSVVFTTTLADRRTMFSGDVLFRGGIGRTDLKGGSDERMFSTLREVILTADDDTLVHCGHGPSTTIGDERRTNPYLQIGRR